MDTNPDLLILLGRLDGKVDTLVAMLGTANSRLDDVENRLGMVEQEVASVKAAGNSSRNWLSHMTSGIAVIIAGLSAYFGIKT